MIKVKEVKEVKEITTPGVSRTFLFPTEDMCVHIIKTGFSEYKRYIVVHEDAYQKDLGKTEIMSAKDIETKFNILL